ncbi:MAG TPA: hypothetical protein VJH91_03030 [Candidatus Paceibacterota bacterium]
MEHVHDTPMLIRALFMSLRRDLRDLLSLRKRWAPTRYEVWNV